MKDEEFFSRVNDCKRVVKDHYLEWDLKLVDDNYSEAPQVDNLILSSDDKLTRNEDDRVSGQQGKPSRTQSQPTLKREMSLR